RVGTSTRAANGPAGVPGVRGFLRRRPRRRQDGRDARRMGLACRSSRKERCWVDGPSRAGAAPRDDRAQPGDLWAARGEYNDQDKMWRWPNGARLRFAYLECDADADAYQGHSYTRVYVEELGTFPSASPVLRLMATLRSGEGVPCGFRATGNPGGPGHQ